MAKNSLIARAVAGFKAASDVFFGPLEPMAPMAPPDTAGRQFDYLPGFNLQIQPRGDDRIGFPQLRALADNYDLLRLVIETRKDQLAALNWAIQPRDAGKKKAAVKDGRIAEATALLECPDGEHDWGAWLRMLAEDMLVVDAATLYPRRTRAGGLYSLDIIDGATIKRLLDDRGRTPAAPDPAYQQVLKGVPATNYTRDQLLYLPRNQRSHKVYGFSPVEQVIMTVDIALRRQKHQLQYYTEGNIPEALIGVPETWTPEQISQFQAYWDTVLEGDTAQRRHARFVPGSIAKGYVATKDAALKDEYDEWLARIICYAFSVSNQAFIKQMNRATADTAQEQALQEGLAPLQAWIKSIIDRVLRECWGWPDLEFAWADAVSIDPAQQAEINDTYLRDAVISINEVRAGLGLDPVPNGNELLIYTANGAVTLDSVINPPAPPPQLGHNGGPPLIDENDGDAPPPPLAKSAWQIGARIDRNRPAIRLGRLAAQKLWTSFLAEEGRRVAKAVAAMSGALAKADNGDPSSDGAGAAASGSAEDLSARASQTAAAVIDGSTWQAPEQETVIILQAAATDGVKEGLTSIGISSADVAALANPRAVAVAQQQGAELVSGLEDVSRAALRDLIVKAEQEGWSVKRLEQAIVESHAFSPERAALIAQHELACADLAGNLAGWRQARDSLGMEVEKAWVEGSEGHHCPACDANYLAGPIHLDKPFPSGAEGAPGHPHCDCDTRAVFKTALGKQEGPRAGRPFDLAKINPFHDVLGRFARAPETGSGSGAGRRAVHTLRLGQMPNIAIATAIGRKTLPGSVTMSVTAQGHHIADHPEDQKAFAAALAQGIGRPHAVGHPKTGPDGTNIALYYPVPSGDGAMAVLPVSVDRDAEGNYRARSGYIASARTVERRIDKKEIVVVK